MFMKYNAETRHATMNFRHIPYTHDEDGDELWRAIEFDPRLVIRRRSDRAISQSFVTIDNHPPFYSVKELEDFLAHDRTIDANLLIERAHTPVDHQSPHPTKRGWNRDLDLRDNQYGENHVVLADYRGKDAVAGPVYTSYRGYNAKLATPLIDVGEERETYTVPIDISGPNTSFWDGEAIIEVSPIAEHWLVPSPERYAILRHNWALVLGTMACYWEIDKALHDNPVR